MLFYFLFYAFAYFMILIPQQWVKHGHLHRLRKGEFWAKALVFLGILGIAAGFSYHHDFVRMSQDLGAGFHAGERYFLGKIGSNTKRLFLYIPVLIVMRQVYDKHTHGLYGLSAKGFDYKPYVVMMLIMFPLIMAASFLPDFLRQYPSFKVWRNPGLFGWEDWQLLLVYELSYAMAFFFVELIFRGALTIGMERVLKADAVLPMVAVYCFLHFGKPLGETVSSIFGGYIIGVIALYSRSILGGCFIHIGIALTMDITAMIQHYFLGRGN